MTSFGDALRKGLEAHERAAAARREMDEVLVEASKEVAAVVGAPIALRFDVVDRPLRGQSLHEATLGIAAPREKVTMIVAKVPRGVFEPLAEAELSELGFPVTLRWGNRLERASDRGGFESALAALLESAVTGEKIARLVARSGEDAAAGSPG